VKDLCAKDFIALDVFEADFPIRIQLDYARDDNVLLGEAVYHGAARLWAHVDMARIVLAAARDVHAAYGLRMVVYDCLRTSDAQQAMLETRRVKDNPHWLEEPRLLSPPGSGAHPRGMAIDVSLESMDGVLLDMGTVFDQMSEDSAPGVNRAHRLHPGLSDAVVENRRILDEAMFGAAEAVGVALVGLPEEWWDFRAPVEVYEGFAPLSDADLPREMRMTNLDAGGDVVFDEAAMVALKGRILEELS